MAQDKTGIFDLIRTNKKFLSVGLITLLLGGWVSVVCQQCLMFAGKYSTTSNENISHTSEHCLPGQENQGNGNAADHCAHDCDCNVTVVTSENFQNSQPGFIKTGFDQQYTHLESEFDLFSKLKTDHDADYYQNPDRSYFLPIDRFCVLLI
jgi:hypothetical protein